jgi:hypothetical protein
VYLRALGADLGAWPTDEGRRSQFAYKDVNQEVNTVFLRRITH